MEGVSHKECTTQNEKRRIPFTMEYILYCTFVFVQGRYDELPLHLKRFGEPNPYPAGFNYLPAMQVLKRGLMCSKCKRPICKANRYPPFYKEFFHRENKLFFTKLRNHFSNPAGNKKPCYICELLKKYPLIEQHPPCPFPDTRCVARKGKHHFRDYYEDVNGIVRKVDKRQPPTRKCKSKANGFYKHM